MLAASILVLLAGGARAQVQEMTPPILSGGLPEATAAQTPVVEEPQQRPATHPFFDTVDLTAIESIGAGSDIRAFLGSQRASGPDARGAPPCLVDRSGDRDFIGLSENSWDFSAPDGIPELGSRITNHAGQLLMEEAENQLLSASDKSAIGLNNSGR